MDAAAALKRADFIDLGASRGNSLLYCQKLFGGRGVGIDVNPRKVEEARAKGLDVVLADARTLELPRGVRFVSACDFLEHLPDLATAREILAGVARAATDFIFIRHPSFEGEEMLRAHGLRQYWHNWSGHPNHMRVSDFCEAFADLGLNRYAICYRERIEHSSHPSIIPLGARRNSGRYEPELHGPKPDVDLPEPVFRAQFIFVALRDFRRREWERIVSAA
jgi:hypothetical protein